MSLSWRVSVASVLNIQVVTRDIHLELEVDFQARVLEETSESPIMFRDIVTKYKKCDKYLGDCIHMDGLAASVEATIQDREGKTAAATHEIKAITNDYRMQTVGGIMGVWDL